MSAYDSCSAYHGADLDGKLQCVAALLDEQIAVQHNTFVEADLQSWLLILAGALVFFMQAGFAMVCAGAIRKVSSYSPPVAT